MPKVTVLMAVYNGERYLTEAIDSILCQTFQDFEFLIVNDGSSDSTREIILSYDDSRIRLVDNECNLGLARSLNRGLELAAGQLIARQDADDISEPERLAKQVAFMETHPDVALLGTWYKKIDAQGILLGHREKPCDCLQIRWSLLFFCPFVHSTVMLRKVAVLSQIGFYNEAITYAEDYELWSRIARCLPVANLNEYLVKFRVNPWSMTTTYRDIHSEPLQIRIANMRHVLGWEKTKAMALNEAQLDTMASLSTYCTDLDAREANRAAQEILRLSTAFYQFYGVDRTARRTHRTNLCDRITYNLLQLANRYFEQDNYAAAGQLFVAACRLHSPILFTKKPVVLLLKLLMGASLVRAIKALTLRGVNS